jgi:hypothetical protein
MMVRHIRLDRRQFYLFEGLGINSQIATNTAVYFAAGDTSVGFTPICGVVSIVVHGNEIES